VTGAKCLAQAFGSATVGSFCFFFDDDDTNCATAANPDLRPYSRMTFATSIDGAPGDYCMTTTTCPAVTDAITQKTCENNASCGVTSVTDGICLPSDQCSYICTEDHDCPAPGFSRCLGAGVNKFCQP
jgi:hypothetical protein